MISTSLLNLGTLMLILGTFLGAYGFLLFMWWWIKVGSATEVYAYVCFLFGAAALMMGFGVASRLILELYGMETYYAFIHSTPWILKSIPLLIVMFLIVLRMTVRVIRTRQFERGKKKERRKQ